jgi:LysM repeat protein
MIAVLPGDTVSKYTLAGNILSNIFRGAKMRVVKILRRLLLPGLIFVTVFTGITVSLLAVGYCSSYYTVVEGDCFWTIADKLGTDADSVQSANPGLDFEALQIGEQLVIPGTDVADTYFGDTNSTYSGETFSYTVVPGDNLWSIADRFGTSVEVIRSASGLDSEFLQVGQQLTVPGNASASQQVSRGSVSRSTTSYNESDSSYGELVDWPYINDMFPMGSNVTLQDFETGRKFRIHHLFGQNHADCEPLTAEDSSIMKEIFGGEWSWERRAAIIWLDGQPIACSMAGMPHGTSQDIYDNDFDGMFDLHFHNSRTHATDIIDPDHQAMVHAAAGQ